MSNSQQRFTEFLHTRGASLCAAVALLVLTLVSYSRGEIDMPGNAAGLVFDSADGWLPDNLFSLILNVGLLCMLSEALVAVNKGFNIMRSMTSMWSMMFLVFECMWPGVSARFSGATLMPVIYIVAMVLLYSCFERPDRRRRVFLIFFMLAVSSLFNYCYMFMIPVFALGLLQMRVLSLRSAIAAMLGVVTPLWILLGSGLVTIDDLHWPGFATPLSHIERTDVMLLVLSVGYVGLTGVGFLIGNAFKMLSYNAKNRAYNGFLALSLVAVIMLCAIDYANMTGYVTLLAVTASYQVAHYFTLRRSTRSYIPVMLIIVGAMIVGMLRATL